MTAPSVRYELPDVCCVCIQALERAAERNHWQRALHTPENNHHAWIPFTPRHVATVRGKLADAPAKAGEVLRGVLVKQQGRDQVLHPDELSTFTKLTAGRADCVRGKPERMCDRL